MTEPNEFELLELAAPYALDAVSDAERADIDRRLASAPSPVAAAFADEVRAIRETMAIVSAATAAEPPAAIASRRSGPDTGRTGQIGAQAPIDVGAQRLLRRQRPRSWWALRRSASEVLLRPAASSTVAEQVMAAPDVRTVSGPLAGGTATVMFSRDRNAGVLVMNNVPPPSPGTVYQMWLIDAKGPTSAGTMDTAAVAPSTTATLAHLGALDDAGVHRRTRHRFAATDRKDIGGVAANLTSAGGCPLSRRAPRTPPAHRLRLANC